MIPMSPMIRCWKLFEACRVETYVDDLPFLSALVGLVAVWLPRPALGWALTRHPPTLSWPWRILWYFILDYDTELVTNSDGATHNNTTTTQQQHNNNTTTTQQQHTTTTHNNNTQQQHTTTQQQQHNNNNNNNNTTTTTQQQQQQQQQQQHNNTTTTQQQHNNNTTTTTRRLRSAPRHPSLCMPGGRRPKEEQVFETPLFFTSPKQSCQIDYHPAFDQGQGEHGAVSSLLVVWSRRLDGWTSLTVPRSKRQQHLWFFACPARKAGCARGGRVQGVKNSIFS